MKKDLAYIGGLFLVLAALLIFGGGFTSLGLVTKRNTAQFSTTSAGVLTSANGTVNLKIKSLDVNAVVASSDTDQKKGLGKRESLPFNQGMLFVFDKVGPYDFWMKDMKFAIDIIWIDQNKKVVKVINNAPAEPGKKDADLTIYKAGVDAKYVLEVNAGLASLNDVQVGDAATF